jgi:hypothetical protein
MMRKQITSVIDQIITASSPEMEPVEPSIISDYKRLNDKCDTVIAKIKARKDKKSTPDTEVK